MSTDSLRKYTLEELGVIAEAMEKIESMRSTRNPEAKSSPRLVESMPPPDRNVRPKVISLDPGGPAPVGRVQTSYAGKWKVMLDAHGGTQEALAAALGVDPATLWKWGVGKTRPRKKNVATIRALAKSLKVRPPA